MYQAAGWIWVIRVSGREGFIRASTGTPDRPTAEAYEAMLTTFHHQQQWDVLDAIVARVVTLQEVFWHFRQGTLDSLMASLTDANLDRMVDEWAGEVEGTKYVQQVRTLIPKGERFPASEFRRKRISLFLSGLKKQRKGTGPVTGNTKKRYKAALSQFAKWLIEREVIETNPVRDVTSIKAEKPRMSWLTADESKALVESLPSPYDALLALMIGTGMEWQAVVAIRGLGDVKVRERTIYARGGKTKYRNRWVVVTEPWAWPAIKRHLIENPEKPFADVSHDDALKIHHAVSAFLGLPRTTLHDQRHTYAVNYLKRGGLPQVVKSQLGHAPGSTVVETTYGAWIVSKEDFKRRRK